MSRSTTLVLRYALGAAALATMVAADALNWGLSNYVYGLLGMTAGWVVRAPGDAPKATSEG